MVLTISLTFPENEKWSSADHSAYFEAWVAKLGTPEAAALDLIVRGLRREMTLKGYKSKCSTEGSQFEVRTPRKLPTQAKAEVKRTARALGLTPEATSTLAFTFCTVTQAGNKKCSKRQGHEGPCVPL